MSPPPHRDLGETIRNRLAAAAAGASSRSDGPLLPGSAPRPDFSLLIRRLGLDMSGLDYLYWCLEHLASQFQLDDAILVIDQPELGHQIFRLRQRSLIDTIAAATLREPGLHLHPAILSDEDRSTVLTLCQSALTFALAKHDAAHDALTGLPNRRSFEEAITQFVANGVRHGTEFSLGLLDVDGLKHINDESGHWRGDRLLQATGRELDRLMRAGEVAARLGGDEFGLLLVGADPSGAIRIRDRLEAAVSNIMGTPIQYSIGVAHSGEAGTDPAILYRLADSRLYQDKRSGRTQPVMIDTSISPLSTVPGSAGSTVSDPFGPSPSPGTPPEPGATARTDSGGESAPGEVSVSSLSVEEQNLLELRLRRVDAVVWAKVSLGPPGSLNVEVAARPGDRSWRDRVVSDLQAETGGQVNLQVLDFEPAPAGPGDPDRPARIKVESVRQRLQYTPGADPIPGIEVQLSHGGRKGTGFAWDAVPTAAVRATLAALADLGLPVPYEIESVTRLGFSASAPVLAVLRRLGTGESRMGVVRRPDAMDAAARAMLDATNRDLERELQGLITGSAVAYSPSHA